MRKKKILISNCLMGIPCRYDGSCKKAGFLEELEDRYCLVGVCPEELGGLETPREPAEIYNGRVITRSGRDVTYEYEYGAELALSIAKGHSVKLALMQDRSPSCGCGVIHNGLFDGGLKEGDGIAVKVLKSAGIEVLPASRAEELL